MNQPKWGHLKQLHEAIKQAEKFFTDGIVETKNISTYVNVSGDKNHIRIHEFIVFIGYGKKKRRRKKIDVNLIVVIS